MRTIKATQLAKSLGLSRYTMRDICRRDTKLSFKKGRVYYIKIEELAKRPGFSLVDAILASSGRWVKAIELARAGNIPERTIRSWCAEHPHLAVQLASMWLINLDNLGASEEQIADLVGRTRLSPPAKE